MNANAREWGKASESIALLLFALGCVHLRKNLFSGHG